VTGLYHALARAGKPVTRVVTFSPVQRDVRDAADICKEEFHRLGVSYANRFFDAEDIEGDDDAREFKAAFNSALQDALATGAEIIAGITGGRTVMGALMAIVAQTAVGQQAPDRVKLYYLSVDDAIAEDGQLPRLWDFRDTPRWREILAPPPGKSRLVRVPYVRFL
jgi:hypothetical protein